MYLTDQLLSRLLLLLLLSCLQAHLRSHDWGSAFHISRAYGLDADVVYRARWAASPVSRASISDNLPKLRDRRAAVAECLSRIALVRCWVLAVVLSPVFIPASLLLMCELRGAARIAESVLQLVFLWFALLGGVLC
jgi:hypothetical protein